MTSDSDENTKTLNYTNQQKAFFKSDIARTAKIELNLMMNDPKYNTREIFTVSQSASISFVDRHMKYLSEHPKLDPRHYLSNLRLMTKIKS